VLVALRGLGVNHNETLLSVPHGVDNNHNETVLAAGSYATVEAMI